MDLKEFKAANAKHLNQLNCVVERKGSFMIVKKDQIRTYRGFGWELAKEKRVNLTAKVAVEKTEALADQVIFTEAAPKPKRKYTRKKKVT